MKYENMVPCCYFPTTIVLVDDNQNFLSLISPKIAKHWPIKSFQNPNEALNYLITENNKKIFLDRCLSLNEDSDRDHCNMDINISSIQKEVEQPNRYSEITVVLVDYAMPGLNGAELCEQLKKTRFKIVLLTGEANIETAVKLFNTGTIHRYLNKIDENYLDKLMTMIKELQYEYFIDQSKLIINGLVSSSSAFRFSSCLVDPAFINFFKDFLNQHKFIEYYLYDESGSFMLLDEKGNASWLIVLNESEMEATEYELKLGDIKVSPYLREAILNREVLRYSFDDDQYPSSKEKEINFDNFFYPAKKFESKNRYYYSYIEKPKVTPKINYEKIQNYRTYMSSYFKNNK